VIEYNHSVVYLFRNTHSLGVKAAWARSWPLTCI